MRPGKLVLVIDDDNDVREAIRDLLAVDGIESAEARDGSSGLGYLRSHGAPGMILLDWNMAPMNGAAFMSEFSRDATLSSIPVVVVTADGRAGQTARAQGLSTVLKKPVDPDELLKIAHRHCFGDP